MHNVNSLDGICESLAYAMGIEPPSEALAELRLNSSIFATFSKMIETNSRGHNTLVGFAMDHGCHEIDGESGAHGLDMDEDINIVHLYKAYKRGR